MEKLLIKAAEKVVIKVNEEKMEYMIISQENRNHVQEIIEVEGYIVYLYRNKLL